MYENFASRLELRIVFTTGKKFPKSEGKPCVVCVCVRVCVLMRDSHNQKLNYLTIIACTCLLLVYLMKFYS